MAEELEVTESEQQPEQKPDETAVEYDKRIKGLETAAANERKKRQLAEQELERFREQAKEPPREPQKDVPKAPDFDAEFETRYAAKERQKRLESWQSTMTEAQQRYEDVDLRDALEDVGTTLGRFGQSGHEIADQIIASDKSWDVLAHLKQHPDELNRLSRMSPVAAAVEIGRIESRLGVPAKKVSGAPAPIRPNSSAVRPEKDPDDMTLSEYEQYMRERRGGSVWPK